MEEHKNGTTVDAQQKPTGNGNDVGDAWGTGRWVLWMNQKQKARKSNRAHAWFRYLNG